MMIERAAWIAMTVSITITAVVVDGRRADVSVEIDKYRQSRTEMCNRLRKRLVMAELHVMAGINNPRYDREIVESAVFEVGLQSPGCVGRRPVRSSDPTVELIELVRAMNSAAAQGWPLIGEEKENTDGIEETKAAD